MKQIRQLEQHFGRSSLSASLSLEKDDQGTVLRPHELEEKGREWFCETTGGKVLGASAVGQLIKLREKDERDEEIGEVGVGEGVLGRTEKVVLESQLFSSLFVGRSVSLSSQPLVSNVLRSFC